MKTLKFRRSLVDKILKKEKYVTWRLFDDKDLKTGDELDLAEWETGRRFARAIVLNVREKKMGDINDGDFRGHEKFTGPEEMMATYRDYYGDVVGEDTRVKIIEFKIL